LWRAPMASRASADHFSFRTLALRKRCLALGIDSWAADRQRRGSLRALVPEHNN
jgi:hypothetical protein